MRYILISSTCLITAFISLAALAVPQKPQVFAKPLQKSDLADSVTYPARVVSKISAAILSESDGRIVRVDAPLGSTVKSGKTILVIKNLDAAYDYAPAAVTAAVSGVVSQLDVTVGTQVTRGQKLGTITDPHSLSLALEIPAQDLELFANGQTGEFALSQAKETPHAVKIRGISALVDPATGTASAEVALVPTKESRATLRPGLLGQVRFKVNPRQGYSVLEDALVYRGQDSYLRLIQDSKAKLVAVKLGRRSQGAVEITPQQGEFPANATYIERASQFVADGDEVVVSTPAKTTDTEAK